MEVAPPAAFSFPREDERLKDPPSSVFLDSLVGEAATRPVPNHLLESKVYMKLGSNVSVAADPGILHFGGFEIGKCHRRVLKLVNISADVSNVHIIPPQSKHFTIRYKKANRLVPGLALTVDIHFIADEWRYYYDCIRVHCKGDETLLVPLHAFPVMDLPDFPPFVDLSDVALGQSSHYAFPLRCSSPVDFEFRIACSQPHKDFIISPTSGMVSASGPVEVTVTYTPSSYGTAQIRLELLISELNATPHVCVITGTCSPKLTAKKDSPEDVHTSPKGRPQDHQKPSHGVSRKKRHLHTLQQNASQIIEFQNLRFPVNLSNPHAVSSVLNQQPGKLKIRDLREGLTDSDKKVKSRQEKETRFQQVMKENITEEEANQLRWQVHLGCDPISAEQRHVISADRQSAEAEYQVMRGRPDLAAEYRREAALARCRRVLRSVDECPRMQPQFDLYLNDLWGNRIRALRRFQQAARTVLLRGRVDGRLSSLRKLLRRLQWEREGSAMCESSDEETSGLSAPQVLSYEFPPYPAEPERSVLEAPVSPPPRAAAAPLQHPLCLQDLQVPQHSQLMSYHPVRSRGGSSLYQPRHLMRPLRRGAEDELTAERSPKEEVPAPEEEEGPALRPPETLLNPPNYHPLHVFNPAPGLVAFKRPLSYSEVDLQHHLCPLPRSPAQQEGSTARKEIIRGVLSWKKFPTVSLSIPLPASEGRRPHWCDPFSMDLLPASGPPALSSLPAEDKENIAPRDRNEGDSKVWLTPDMLRAEFTAAPDTLDTGEQDGESRLPGEGNSFMNNVQENLKRMKLRSHNTRLILD